MIDILDILTPSLFSPDSEDAGGDPVGPLPSSPAAVPVGLPLRCSGVDVINLDWDGPKLEQLPLPVRKLNRLMAVYVFREYDGRRLDIRGFARVTLEYKRGDDVTFSSVPASFVGNKARGAVKVPVIKFPSVGKWDVHFVLWDYCGNPAYFGTPLQFDVVKNVRDLVAGETLGA